MRRINSSHARRLAATVDSPSCERSRDEEQRLPICPRFARSIGSKSSSRVRKCWRRWQRPMATRPALVVQPFGRGRTAALLVGDLWRWDLRREEHTQSDLEKSWRQTASWLVADVPQPVEVETRRASALAWPPRRLSFGPATSNSNRWITRRSPSRFARQMIGRSNSSLRAATSPQASIARCSPACSPGA